MVLLAKRTLKERDDPTETFVPLGGSDGPLGNQFLPGRVPPGMGLLAQQYNRSTSVTRFVISTSSKNPKSTKRASL